MLTPPDIFKYITDEHERPKDKLTFERMQQEWIKFKRSVPSIRKAQEIQELIDKHKTYLSQINKLDRLKANIDPSLSAVTVRTPVYDAGSLITLNDDDYRKVAQAIRDNISRDPQPLIEQLEMIQRHQQATKALLEQLPSLESTISPELYQRIHQLDGQGKEILANLRSPNIEELSRMNQAWMTELNTVEAQIGVQQRQWKTVQTKYEQDIEVYQKLLTFLQEKTQNQEGWTLEKRYEQNISAYLEQIKREEGKSQWMKDRLHALHPTRSPLHDFIDQALRKHQRVIDEGTYRRQHPPTNKQYEDLQLTMMDENLKKMKDELRKQRTTLHKIHRSDIISLDLVDNLLMLFTRFSNLCSELDRIQPKSFSLPLSPPVARTELDLAIDAIIRGCDDLIPKLKSEARDRVYFEHLRKILTEQRPQNLPAFKSLVEKQLKSVNRHGTIGAFFMNVITHLKKLYLEHVKHVAPSHLKLFDADQKLMKNNPAVKVLKKVMERKHIELCFHHSRSRPRG